MAQSEAIRRVLRSRADWVDIRSTERILDPGTGKGVWEIVLVVSKGRR